LILQEQFRAVHPALDKKSDISVLVLQQTLAPEEEYTRQTGANFDHLLLRLQNVQRAIHQLQGLPLLEKNCEQQKTANQAYVFPEFHLIYFRHQVLLDHHELTALHYVLFSDQIRSMAVDNLGK